MFIALQPHQVGGLLSFGFVYIDSDRTYIKISIHLDYNALLLIKRYIVKAITQNRKTDMIIDEYPNAFLLP
jgi:hypothetical protein